MSSPRYETFFVTNSSGTPLTGAAGGMSFALYTDDTGSSLSAPTITEVGQGLYKFAPTMPASLSRGVMYVVNTGSGNLPSRYWRYIRSSDWDGDDIPGILQQFLTGRQKIHTTGPEANRFVVYGPDNTTIIYRYDLKDQLGVSSPLNPFDRIPA